MAHELREHVEVVSGDGLESRRRVTEVATPARQVVISRVAKIIWLTAALMMMALGFRFVLLLIEANPATGFVNFVYDVTDVLVAPFNGIVEAPTLSSGGVIDIASLFAIVVYALAAWALVTLIVILFAGRTHSRRVTTVQSERERPLR
jgi:hypothetical protein